MDLIIANMETVLFLLLLIITAWSVGICMMYLGGVYLSNATMKAIQESTTRQGSNKMKKKIKKIYKIHLEASAVFYYLFLPLPVFVVMLISGSLLYLLDHYNINSYASIGGILIISLIMISSIIRSLYLKNINLPEELLLKRQDAPELFRMCDDISGELGMKPLDSIYVTHDASISVFESGRILNSFLGKTKRCLMIGIAALGNLSVSQLESILAHEHGHLYNKDTAGGSFALFVRRSIQNATDIMKRDLVDHWYNPSWLYIFFFQKVFIRISRGAARLQELMADEISAELYGSEMFSESLLNITRTQIEFSVTSDIEFMNALNNSREPNNIYRLNTPRKFPDDVTYSYGYTFMTIDRPDGMKSPSDLIATEYERELNLETDPFDTHPSVKDRIAQVRKMAKPTSRIDNTNAETVIPDIEAWQEDFTRSLYASLVAEREHLTNVEYEKRLSNVLIDQGNTR